MTIKQVGGVTLLVLLFGGMLSGMLILSVRGTLFSLIFTTIIVGTLFLSEYLITK